MLYICITADHELYSGKNLVNEHDVVIKPTEMLLQLLEKYGIPLTLFSDVCSIWKYRECGWSEFPDQMEEQMKHAIMRGHDVQLHIHPHWLYSEKVNGQWIYKPEYFRMHEFDSEYENKSGNWNSFKFISEGKRYLDNLLKPLKSTYSCIAFRAGGWCLQPEQTLMNSLVENGIYIDTTIFRGGYESTSTHYFDFRDTPMEMNWWIDPEQGIHKKAKPNKNYIFEVCIGSYSKHPNLVFKKLYFKYLKRKRKLYSQQVKGVSAAINNSNNKYNITSKIHSYLFNPISLTFDGSCTEEMICIIEHYIKSFDCIKNDYYVSLIGHPKNTEVSNILELENFIKWVRNNCAGLVSFTTLSEVNTKVREQLKTQ